MIAVTRLTGSAFLLNPDLIERVESTPDTVVTLLNGTKYVVAESLESLAAAVRAWRAEVLSSAGTVPEPPRGTVLRVVPTGER